MKKAVDKKFLNEKELCFLVVDLENIVYYKTSYNNYTTKNLSDYSSKNQEHWSKNGKIQANFRNFGMHNFGTYQVYIKLKDYMFRENTNREHQNIRLSLNLVIQVESKENWQLE